MLKDALHLKEKSWANSPQIDVRDGCLTEVVSATGGSPLVS